MGTKMEATRREFINFKRQLLFPRRQTIFERCMGRIRKGSHANFYHHQYYRFPSTKFEKSLVERDNKIISKRQSYNHRRYHSFQNTFCRIQRRNKNYTGCVLEKTIDDIIKSIKNKEV